MYVKHDVPPLDNLKIGANGSIKNKNGTNSSSLHIAINTAHAASDNNVNTLFIVPNIIQLHIRNGINPFFIIGHPI